MPLDDFLRDDAPASGGALTALRDAAYSGAPLKESMDYLLGSQVIDPSTKWHAYAAAALKPASGGFGESMGNAVGALAGAQTQESELKAKYIPLVAQAMIQRQMQMAQLAMNQWRLNQEFDQAGTGALTGLLSKRGEITSGDVVNALGSAVQRGMLPPEHAKRIYGSLPFDEGPDAVRAHIQRMAISRTAPNEALTATTPKVTIEDTGGEKTPVNTNPLAGSMPLGATPQVPPVPKSLAPVEKLPEVKTDTAGNPTLVDRVNGQTSYPTPVANPALTGGKENAPVAPEVKTPAGKALDEAGGKDLGDYSKQLNSRVEAMRDVQNRFGEMRKLVGDFRPGAAGEMRAKLGSWVDDLAKSLGLSPEQARKMSKTVGGGDISSAQAFQKLAVQGAMEALQAAMNNGRITQGEFGVFRQNSPSLAMDADAIDKMMNFVTRQYQLASTEQAEFNKFRKTNADVLSWPSVWNARARELGYFPVVEAEGSGKGSPKARTQATVNVSKSGKRIRLNDQGVYEYE